MLRDESFLAQVLDAVTLASFVYAHLIIAALLAYIPASAWKDQGKRHRLEMMAFNIALQIGEGRAGLRGLPEMVKHFYRRQALFVLFVLLGSFWLGIRS